ncbi:MAG: signal peptidase I [Bacillota bacterium]
MSETIKKEILSWVKTFIFAIVLAAFANTFLIVNAKVPTGSMENTIMPGDRILALRTSYWFDSPEHGDIIVFRYPDDPEILYLKRVIGTGGDEILIENGEVYLNGVLLNEPYLKEEAYGSFGPYVVPEGFYFAMGDNRNSSEDSRYWDNTYIEEDEILGKVQFSYYQQFRWLS